MFVKGKENKTLEENFLEEIKVEKYLVAISSHQGNKESKISSLDKNTKKNNEISKSELDKKDKDPTDMESMQRIIKQLTNEIIDLKNNKGEGNKPFKPFLKKKTNTNSPPQILLLWVLIWKIMLLKTIVICIIKIIQKEHGSS